MSTSYLLYLNTLLERFGSPQEGGYFCAGHSSWHHLTAKFSNPILSQHELDLLLEFGSLVEIGAGSGWVKFQLMTRAEETGASIDVAAFDLAPAAEPWSEVAKGNETAVRDYADRTLLLCWPPDEVTAADSERGMGVAVLQEFINCGGKRFVYIGDPRPLICGQPQDSNRRLIELAQSAFGQPRIEELHHHWAAVEMGLDPPWSFRAKDSIYAFGQLKH